MSGFVNFCHKPVDFGGIMSKKILIVDDDVEFLTLLSFEIQSWGYEIVTLNSSKGLEDKVGKEEPDLVLLDVMLGDENGIDLVSRVQKVDPKIPIVMISSLGDTKVVVEAMKEGASDYILKTDKGPEFRKKIDEIFNYQKTRTTEANLTNELNLDDKVVVGPSPKTKQLIHEVSKVSVSDATVFLRGESGTGKSMIAELIHEHSDRHGKPFVTINCSAIPETLIESELFGHVKGAFTGATQDKVGKFEHADGGTVFLDEIGELNTDMQVKILRVLQSQEFERVGGLKTIKVNVRVIAATNRNIEEAIASGDFREDLFYRLNVLPLYVPALRERRDDVPYLVDRFVQNFSTKMAKKFGRLSPNVLKQLIDYDWPGNIRELQNVVERAVILGKEPHLKLTDFVINTKPLEKDYSRQASSTPAITSVQDLEYRSLIKALEDSNGNMSKAARLLGVCRDTLYRRLKKYGIQTKTQREAAPPM